MWAERLLQSLIILNQEEHVIADFVPVVVCDCEFLSDEMRWYLCFVIHDDGVSATVNIEPVYVNYIRVSADLWSHTDILKTQEKEFPIKPRLLINNNIDD